MVQIVKQGDYEKRSKTGLYYTLYDEPYVARSQANCMAHVFEKILNKNPHQLINAMSQLKCLSETDYNSLQFIQKDKSSLPPYSPIPSGFRTCKIFEVKGKKVCLGTSYNEKDKLKYIEDLILLCQESRDIFIYRIDPIEHALSVDGRYRQAVLDSILHYRLFNKERSTNQSEFMACVFEECFKRNPKSIDWALENLDCLYEIETKTTGTSKWKPIFRTHKKLSIYERELMLGTSLSLADKIIRINKLLRAGHFDPGVYELLDRQGENEPIKLDSRQQQAVEAVLSAVRNKENPSELGYVSMVSGSGVSITALGTLKSLRAENPNRWAYLFVTDTGIGKEQLVQQLKRYQMYYHEVESGQALEREEWEPDSITVSTVQKFQQKNDGSAFSKKSPIILSLSNPPYTTDKPVMVIFYNARSLSAKSNISALRSTFTKGTYLAFCNNPPDGSGWLNRCLYSYSLEQAITDGYLLPIKIECKNFKAMQTSFYLRNMIINVMAQQEVNKCVIVCDSIDMAEQYSSRLSVTDFDSYVITTKQSKNQLNREIEGFCRSQRAVAFMVDLWDAIDVPPVDIIIVTRQLHSKAMLLQMASKVARPGPGKKFGQLVLFGVSEALLAAWELPLCLGDIQADAIIGDNRAIKYEALYTQLRNQIGFRHFEEAFDTFASLRQLDTQRCRLLDNDLAFLFLPEKSLEENKYYWRNHTEIVEQRAAIWYALTGETQRHETAEITSDSAETLLQESAQPESALPKPEPVMNAQEIGEIFENNMKSLLQELLTANGGGIEITEFRRQNSGTQFGFDLRCTYSDPDGQLCYCLFECKKTAEINMGDMTGKLSQARMSERPVHHWILVSPSAKISNDLDNYLPRLKDEVKEGRWEPVQNIQVWTPDQGVEELFALMPEIYDYYYPDGTLDPRTWPMERREAVAARWRKNLKPGLMLPKPWQKYLYNPANLLAIQEERRAYEGIYSNYVPLRCIGEDGTPISGTAEEYIINWLEQPAPAAYIPDTLFLLGDFGDGKSYLTYTLSRHLAERFVEAPGKRYLPLRLLLSDLRQGVSPQDFLRQRLDQFGADLGQWKTLLEKYRMLVILDGFDEMSSGMDLQTVEKNAVRLCETVKFFIGTKVIVTSRYPVFQMIKEKLTSYFTAPKTIRLLPVSFRKKMDCLSAFAAKNNCLERLRRLCATHDVMGLASKPLFLDMMKSILLDEGMVEPNSISIYSSFSRATMERKALFEREEILIDKEKTLNAVWNILEKYALILTGKSDYGITMEEFLKDYRPGGDESLAKDIWQSLTEPTICDEEDAENRLTSRTLLKPSKSGYVFCHRSMQEYYTARGLCHLLLNQPMQAREYITDTDLSYETTRFLAAMLSEMNHINTEKAQLSLADMVTATRGCAKDDNRIARMGATALNLYYAAWKRVPEIDWRGLVLNNVILNGADLSNLDVSGTSLRYANLDNVNIVGANFSFCDLTGVRLDETKDLLMACPADEDQPYLYALYGDSILRKWKNFHEPQCTVISTGDQYTGLKVSYGGMVLYSDRHLYFGNMSSEDIVSQGGIYDLKDAHIYDITDKRLVYSRDGLLTLYDLENCRSIVKDYPVEESAAVEILNDNQILVYHNGGKARIVGPNAQEGWSLTPVEGLADEETLMNLTAVQVDKDIYLLCCVHNNSVIRLYCVTCTPKLETHLLNETSMAYTIRMVTFSSSQILVCAGQNGILHILNITEEYALQEISQCKSKILCEGCVVDGLEPQQHRERLLAYGARVDC